LKRNKRSLSYKMTGTAGFSTNSAKYFIARRRRLGVRKLACAFVQVYLE
jgi:hypothetical protein